MRHLFSALLLCLTVPALPEAASAVEPATVEMELERVSDHVWYVQGAAGVATGNQGFVSNAGVVIGTEAVAVFDALGTPALAERLVELIRRRSDLPIRHVVVSHYHADHIYGLQVFEKLGARIHAPRGVSEYLSSENARARLAERRISLYPWVDEDTRLVAPDDLVGSEPVTLDLGGGVRLQLVRLGAAHSDADLAMRVQPDQVLFSGDIIFEGRVPFVGDADSRTWLAILESLSTEGIRALVPGHGPMAGDPQATIELTRRYLAYLREVMGAAVESMTPFDQAYAAADWSEFEDLPAFEAANRRNAYQVYLALEAEQFGSP